MARAAGNADEGETDMETHDVAVHTKRHRAEEEEGESGAPSGREAKGMNGEHAPVNAIQFRVVDAGPGTRGRSEETDNNESRYQDKIKRAKTAYGDDEHYTCRPVKRGREWKARTLPHIERNAKQIPPANTIQHPPIVFTACQCFSHGRASGVLVQIVLLAQHTPKAKSTLGAARTMPIER
ncbi:hypothetical protein K438DRAFT_1764600 [Mycena galopus ATCC 62051]|nr:hypothetical protein K438DRAFT_1764600 [Mycena galopus ATCC 62051]